MHKLIIFLTGLWFALGSFGNIPDSTLYTSDFERSAFTKHLQSAPLDTIDLFVALDYRPDQAAVKIRKFSEELKLQMREYPLSKKLKTIFKSVHQKFLTKYSEEAFFNDIFVSGDYNCLTTSALYAFVLSELNIKYLIKQTPNHVYLVADPDQSCFLIETTLPREKAVQYTEREKVDYRP
jgi:hypothetical protein